MLQLYTRLHALDTYGPNSLFTVSYSVGPASSDDSEGYARLHPVKVGMLSECQLEADRSYFGPILCDCDNENVEVRAEWASENAIRVFSSTNDPSIVGQTVRVEFLTNQRIEELPTWWLLLISGMLNEMNGIQRAAFLDYAASFEAFLSEYLRHELSLRMEEAFIDIVMSKHSRMVDKTSELFQSVFECKFTSNRWGSKYRSQIMPRRNKVSHGSELEVNPELFHEVRSM